jgi:histidinol dehydrogenase
MKIIQSPARSQWSALCQRPQIELEFLESAVCNVLDRVKKSGDEALKALTLQYDKVSIDHVQVTQAEMDEAIASLPRRISRPFTLHKSGK